MNPRLYGQPPYRVAVVHGGPGAGGEMAPVARRLSGRHGVLEPIQTACSVDGQVEELRACLEAQGAPPLALIGHSWGAWLCVIVAARHPELVRKLLLVSSGPFEERYVAELEQARRDRLSPVEREELSLLMGRIARPDAPDKDRCLARLGELGSTTDAFDPLPRTEIEADGVEPRGEIFRTVWSEAAAMRRDGRLLDLARLLHCEVAAIHGDYDPHPARGVLEPLSEAIPGLRFILLSRCGHTPWRSARRESDSTRRSPRSCEARRLPCPRLLHARTTEHQGPRARQRQHNIAGRDRGTRGPCDQARGVARGGPIELQQDAAGREGR